ncbi:ANTAR domain-containing protein [Lentzea sp.]|uniref:ANTAR domain-containing protein n=1 Tax=Lentzea sp. TaxID=56099 RepID=UPI002ED417C3
MPTGLDVTTSPSGEAVVVRLTGDVTGTGAEVVALRNAVLTDPVPDRVTFELRGTRLLSAAGLRMLLDVIGLAQERDVRCSVLVGRGSPVAGVLEVTGLPASAGGEVLVVRQPVERDVDVRGALRELASLVGSRTAGEVLSGVATAASRLVPGADLVSVTLRDRTGASSSPAGTESVVQPLDAVQRRSGRGPCLDAARPDGPGFAVSDDLSAEPRWPEFAESAAAFGFSSVLVVDPPAVGRPPAPRGALSIYSRCVGGLTAGDLAVASALAGHAALALAHVTTTELAAVERRQLLRAMASRDVIGQAKGILMARQGMTGDEAFAVLRSTSQDLNVKLVELARTLASNPAGLEG